MPFTNVTSDSALQSALAANKSAVVLFGAVWSPLSTQTKQAFEKSIPKHTTTHFLYVDIDSAPQLQKAYTVEAIPTAFAYKSKVEVGKYVGPMTVDTQVDGFVKKAA